MFQPPYCPYRHCTYHQDPPSGFCVRSGTYHPLCRPHPVQRYRCKGCRRSFSRQTFRADYRDHKPHLNARLVELAASGVGIRQSSRTVGLSLRCTELKLRKIGRHLRRLNLNLRGQLPERACLHFDELETYEGERSTRPLTLPILVESESRFIIWAESETIRPRGRMTARRRERIALSEEVYGPRRDRSRRACLRVLKRGAEISERLASVILDTDEKSTYPGLAAEAFGEDRLEHRRTNSRVVRDTRNPLFPINHEEAIVRDLSGRLRRESWLVSKHRRYLDIAIHIHIAYRNLVRRRFNRDFGSPARFLGFLPRRLTIHELLSWTQIYGRRSIHPICRRGTTIEHRMGPLSAAA